MQTSRSDPDSDPRAKPVNSSFLPGNACYGCGHDNPCGLKIEIFVDEEREDRLRGLFEPTDTMTGFPGLTHGGVIYTALDCIAAWTPTVLRRERHAIWILRSASIEYLRVAHKNWPLRLWAWIEEEGADSDSVTVRTQARREDGELLVEGSFKVVALPPDKFKRISGIAEFPVDWDRLLDGDEEP